jgi:hypothetical protein
MSKVDDIRNEIVNLLDSLSVIGEVKELSGMENLKNEDPASYPVAFVKPPNIGSTEDTNRSNTREHQFEIEIYEKKHNIDGPADICDLQQDILDQFDDNITLSGVLDEGLEPAITRGAPKKLSGTQVAFLQLFISAKANYHQNF